MATWKIVMALAAILCLGPAARPAQKGCIDLAAAEHSTMVSAGPGTRVFAGRTLFDFDGAPAFATAAINVTLTPLTSDTEIATVDETYDFGNGDTLTVAGQLLQLRVTPLLYSTEGKVDVISGQGRFAGVSGTVKYAGGVHVTPQPLAVDALFRLKGEVCPAGDH
jgi:hypothetical protein